MNDNGATPQPTRRPAATSLNFFVWRVFNLSTLLCWVISGYQPTCKDQLVCYAKSTFLPCGHAGQEMSLWPFGLYFDAFVGGFSGWFQRKLGVGQRHRSPGEQEAEARKWGTEGFGGKSSGEARDHHRRNKPHHLGIFQRSLHFLQRKDWHGVRT